MEAPPSRNTDPLEEDQRCSEEVTDRGRFYQMEVKVPDSDEDTSEPSAALSEAAGVLDDVTAPDVTYEPPESLSLVGGAAGSVNGQKTVRFRLSLSLFPEVTVVQPVWRRSRR